MLSQTFCYWNKQQSADSNIIQLHLTLKCTKDQSFHFYDCFLVSKWIFQHHDRGLTIFHAGSEQPLVCVVTINFIYLTVKSNNTAYHVLGNYLTQARDFLNYRLKYCWPKVIYCSICVNQTNLSGKLRKKLGDQAGANQKSGGNDPLRLPLRIATGFRKEGLITC